MKNYKLFLFFSLIFCTLSFINCKNDNKNTQNELVDSLLINPETPNLIKYNEKIFCIPSPFQITMLIKDLQIEYNKDYINSPTQSMHKLF